MGRLFMRVWCWLWGITPAPEAPAAAVWPDPENTVTLFELNQLSDEADMNHPFILQLDPAMQAHLLARRWKGVTKPQVWYRADLDLPVFPQGLGRHGVYMFHRDWSDVKYGTATPMGDYVEFLTTHLERPEFWAFDPFVEEQHRRVRPARGPNRDLLAFIEDLPDTSGEPGPGTPMSHAVFDRELLERAKAPAWADCPTGTIAYALSGQHWVKRESGSWWFQGDHECDEPGHTACLVKLPKPKLPTQA